MKAFIDEELCIGCGQCEEICPEVFEVCDEKALVIGEEIPMVRFRMAVMRQLKFVL